MKSIPGKSNSEGKKFLTGFLFNPGVIIIWMCVIVFPSYIYILDYLSYYDSENKRLSPAEQRQIEKGELYHITKWYWLNNRYYGLGGWETSPNGEEYYVKFYGDIFNGEPYGTGYMTSFPSGSIISSGYYKFGVLVSGEKISLTGFSQGGKWKRGKLHGSGSWIFSNGELWLGNFEDGLLNGKGSKFYADGKLKEEGEYKDHDPVNVKGYDKHRNIIYTFKNGRKQK